MGQIALDDGLDRVVGQFRFAVTVDLHQAGSVIQRQHRAPHRQHAGVQDIEFIDLSDRRLANGPAMRMAANLILERGNQGAWFGIIRH